MDDRQYLTEIDIEIASLRRRIADLERYPRFSGNKDAQLLWLGATDDQRLAQLGHELVAGLGSRRNITNRCTGVQPR